MNDIPCEVVRDLLPSYADGLTDEKTRAIVEEHIAGCDECRAALLAMRESEEPERDDGKKEIDFLKKNRKKTAIIAAVAASCAIVLALLAVLLKLFVIGRGAGGESLRVFLEVDGNSMSIKAEAADPDRAVSALSFTETNGTVAVSARTVVKSFLHSGRLEKTYGSDDTIKAVSFNGNLIYENGVYSMTFSEAMKQEVKSSWERYMALPELERYLQSTTPGFVIKYFGSWQDALDYMGFGMEDPFENDPDFTERICKEPFGEGVPFTALLTWYGDQMGSVNYACLQKYYSYGDLSVQFQAEPMCRAARIDGGESFFVQSYSAFGPDLPDGIVTSRDSGANYNAANILFISNGVRYCIRLIDNVRNDSAALENAIAVVQAKAESMIEK